MKTTDLLKEEIRSIDTKKRPCQYSLLAEGYNQHLDDANVIARAYAIASLFRGVKKHVYKNDLIVGSVAGLFDNDISDAQAAYNERIVGIFPNRNFFENSDHFAADYEILLRDGISGIIKHIDESLAAHDQPEELDFLNAAKITMLAFSDMILGFADAADAAGNTKAAESCRRIATEKPASFRDALQLTWLCHRAFYLEGRYAMALARMDQYLYPFYENDINKGIITRENALELLENTLIKIYEARFFGGDDVVNIVIGGVKRDGSNAVNPLSYLLLEAVKNCGISGPNLTARIHPETPDDFFDLCLQVIGSGIGYPALINDEVSIPALLRCGYELEDVRDHCMVGCIENFLPGKQPPWSDGRYNSPKYLELALNNGISITNGVRMGPATGEPEELDTMEKFLAAVEEQMRYGAALYMADFRGYNDKFNTLNYQQPFLSCFCEDCIGRALDINRGGTKYPSIHGAGCMGVGTMSDSLAAIEELVYNKKEFSLAKLRDILAANFEGYEAERNMMIKAPKYGNNIPFVDKYAEWFVRYHYEIFDKYRTRDGGKIYIGIASNTQNISAGTEIGATPDGRKAFEPLSDAASPTHGMDKNGPTAVVNSVTKPDYSYVSCGTVINQKYSPTVFSDPEKRAKLAALLRVYFKKGGQEMQINSVSRDVLIDAMDHPENYRDLVVRVSGFSAFYINLNRDVQLDILKRTENS